MATADSCEPSNVARMGLAEEELASGCCDDGVAVMVVEVACVRVVCGGMEGRVTVLLVVVEGADRRRLSRGVVVA